jgi:arylsulfatase A-like enzyme
MNVLCKIGFASLVVAAGSMLVPGCNMAGESSKPPPNIIFFLVDDMGWQETSVPFLKEKTMLNDRYHTPNMETLASQGMKFTQAYACALCSPTRVSLMTGLNAARHGVTNWTLRKNVSPDIIHKTLEIPSWNVNGLSPVPGVENTCYAKTLPMYLQEAGYTTIHAGKAHWGAQGTPGENPLNLGFDVNIAGHCAGGPGSYYGKYNFSAAWRNADLIWDVPGLEKYHGQDINLTEALTREAMTSMEKAVEKRKPFYLYMSHYEGGIRVPMIVRWPGVTATGSVCDQPLIIEDFFPSILAMAGVKKYKQIGGKIDGKSFVPMLQGKKLSTGQMEFIWHFPHNYDFEPYSVIRQGDWKLIYWYKEGKMELYNIPEDISEKNDLSATHPKIVKNLASRLGKYLKSVGAKAPVEKSNGIARPFPDEIEIKH